MRPERYRAEQFRNWMTMSTQIIWETNSYRHIQSMLCVWFQAFVFRVSLAISLAAAFYKLHGFVYSTLVQAHIGHTIDLRINRFDFAFCLYNCACMYTYECCTRMYVWHFSHQVFSSRAEFHFANWKWLESFYSIQRFFRRLSVGFFFSFSCSFRCFSSFFLFILMLFFLFFFISMFHVWLLHFSQALTTPLNQHTHHTAHINTNDRLYIEYTCFRMKSKSHGLQFFSDSQNFTVVDNDNANQTKAKRPQNRNKHRTHFRRGVFISFHFRHPEAMKNEKKDTEHVETARGNQSWLIWVWIWNVCTYMGERTQYVITYNLVGIWWRTDIITRKEEK